MRNIYNHQFWCEYMSVHNTILCNLFVFKKKPSKYFFKRTKAEKENKTICLKQQIFTVFIPTFQAYNKAKVEEYILLVY